MSEIRVDTIAEKTSANGVSIDGLTIKDGNINESVKIVGTTPTLTIGDAGAEDAKIVFDGNAQDFHIGLDDSVDDLIIGKGSTLGTTPAITINEDLQTTIANHANPTNAFRNLIINGDMSIAQRAKAATTITNNSVHYATVDRFAVYEYSGAVLTSEQHDMSAADQATTGQSKAMEFNVTTADTSIASGEWCFFTQSIEAQLCQHALYGTSAAKNLTLSFWVKTNKTGTYAVAIDKNDSTRYRLPITYTVDSANTWEKKVINISPTAGSTSLITAANGAIVDDNGIGFFIWWVLAAGTDSQGTNNTWTTSGHYTTSSQVNWLDSTDNNFHITGVQLEVADQASEFEFLPHDIQMQRCQRYFESNYDYEEGDVFPAEDVNYGNMGSTYQGHGYAANVMRYFHPWKVRKRGIPSVTFYRIDGLADGGTAGRWDFFDSTWQQMSGATSVGEASETGMDINLIDEDIEPMESFLIAGGWAADSEL